LPKVQPHGGLLITWFPGNELTSLNPWKQGSRAAMYSVVQLPGMKLIMNVHIQSLSSPHVGWLM